MPKEQLFMNAGAIITSDFSRQTIFKCGVCGASCFPQNIPHPKYLKCEACNTEYTIVPLLYKVTRAEG